ncbi:enolase C-terminal domain-like protein [Cupriavidus necator]|uniref:enolase C-terminal domain-like protein n=1 Tax=Cupriavidus necator TaxID=106590 RepID=UPI0005B547C5|nr:enolase C-terminal domain-like protein [Cupriavidus necator]
MRITRILETTVPLAGNIANALVNFSEHTISLVAVQSDVIRNGKAVTGVAFNSIGRFGQGGILRERMIPRVLAAAPQTLLTADGKQFDASQVLAAALRNEKPGGHGDRASAAAAIELAIWDLNAKLNDEPAYQTIARHYGRTVTDKRAAVYAAGGYYYPDASLDRLKAELKAYQEMGFEAFKMKIGGAPLAEDIARIEAALAIAGDGKRLSVDANGRFDLEMALAYAGEIAPMKLRWYEEVGDPLDYDLNRRIAEQYDGPLATGENLFSTQDVKNLVQFAGLRPGRDIFQMDAGLSYGITEYAKMLAVLEAHGFDRRFAFPHGGHLINLHIAVALGLGGCEAYPGVFQPFGGYGENCKIGGGYVEPTDAPGFGLEEKEGLAGKIADLAF